MSGLTLFAMGEKGFAVLRAIADAHPGLLHRVIAATDRGVADDYFETIRDYCRDRSIPFSSRDDTRDVTSPYAFAVSWRWLISLPATRLIVFHDSLLPRYRGFNPLVSCLLNEEPVIGVTALFASAEYDAGDIIAQASTPISYPIRLQQAVEAISHNYAQLALDIAARIARGEAIIGHPQDESKATFSLWRDDDDYRIDWSGSSAFISRFINAVGLPYKGASTMLNGELARVLEADVVPDVTIENRVAGKVIFLRDGMPVVVCGEGLLRITQLVDDATRVSLLPLKKFRSRFT